MSDRKERAKLYYENNKVEIRKKVRKYFLKNREEIYRERKEKRKERRTRSKKTILESFRQNN